MTVDLVRDPTPDHEPVNRQARRRNERMRPPSLPRPFPNGGGRRKPNLETLARLALVERNALTGDERKWMDSYGSMHPAALDRWCRQRRRARHTHPGKR